MSTKSTSRLLTVIFSIVIGLIILRLFLGIINEYFSVCVQLVWLIIYPMTLLRYLNDDIIFIGLYCVIWVYIILKKIIVRKDPPRQVYFPAILWLIIIALPFVPFHIQYFSLLRYNSAINSYIVRLAPFLGLTIAFLLSNLFYFKQKSSHTIIWAINLTMMTIFLITLADLLPMLNGQPFFNILQYRISIINDLIFKVPIIAQILLIFFAFFLLLIIDNNFIFHRRKKNIFRGLMGPLIVLFILMLFMLVLHRDYYRYRNFDYSSGINTIFLTKYTNRRLIWLDARKIRVVSGNYKMKYPFGDFAIEDTLRQHARQLSTMAIIEGMDYYRLTRIFEILVNGPRDTLIYSSLRGFISGGVYRIPDNLKKLLSYVYERYQQDTEDINVLGWIMLNGAPLNNVDFYVNKWNCSGFDYAEQIWKDKTNDSGAFRFNCFKGEDSTIAYFHIYFMVPDTIISNDISYLKILNIPQNFYGPGNYILDTIKIEITKSSTTETFPDLGIYPFSSIDSFELLVPYVEKNVGVAIKAKAFKSGRLTIVKIDVADPIGIPDRHEIEKEIRDKVKKWRFFPHGEDEEIEIYINSRQVPSL